MSSRTIGWFSTGVASAIACKLMLDTPGFVIVNCDLGRSEDSDNERFLNDCASWYGREITRIKSEKYETIDAVFEGERYLSGVKGAKCTIAMKVVPRLDFQLPSDTHVWGYTADSRDVARFEDMLREYPLMKQRAPLIERGLTKAACFALLEERGIRRPRVYDMGYPNGNCPGCVKASSPDYWALVRLRHPEVFARRAEQSRRLGAKLAIVGRKDGKNIRSFIDEIPLDQPILNPIVPSCDFLCHLARPDMDEAA